MNTKEHCSKCRFFVKGSNIKGDCRRYPPTVYDYETVFNQVKQSYPQMSLNEWCGEFGFKDKFIDLVAKYEPDTNVIAPDFTTTTESFDPPA